MLEFSLESLLAWFGDVSLAGGSVGLWEENWLEVRRFRSLGARNDRQGHLCGPQSFQ